MYLFISDVHLQFDDDFAYQMLLRFLQTKAKEAKTLYILGDLFDLWYGDELFEEARWAPLLEAFKTLNENGTTIQLMRGNHDSLLTQKITKKLPKTYLIQEDLHTINLNGKRILLTHGDILCVNHFSQLLFFYFLRLRILHKIPFRFRKKLATKIYTDSRNRKKSKDHDSYLRKSIKIPPEVIAKQAEHYSIDYLIHGHIHQAGIRQTKGHCTQVTLGAWGSQGAVYALLKNDGSIVLESFK